MADVETAHVHTDGRLNRPEVEDYLRTQLNERNGTFHVRRFAGGSANLNYLVAFDDRKYVLRRPPLGPLPPGAHNMRREHTVLSVLFNYYPYAPKSLLYCDDERVMGSEFVVLEYRPGVVVWDRLPAHMAHLPHAGRRVGFAVVDALADLHRINPLNSPELRLLGRPEGFLARQISGWRTRWARVASYEVEKDAHVRRVVEELGDRLSEAMPSAAGTAILHNDFKLDNCQFSPQDPDRVRSVFDWDMATLGDPLVDLGILLAYWPDPADPYSTATVVTPGATTLGLPAPEKVVDRYQRLTGLSTANLEWYIAFGLWRTAIILRQLYARYVAGQSTDTRTAQKNEQVGPLALRGLSLVASTQHGMRVNRDCGMEFR